MSKEDVQVIVEFFRTLRQWRDDLTTMPELMNETISANIALH
jgi:hypothetical protein